MIIKLALHVISAILGLYLASYFIPGIDFVGNLKTLFIAGLIMGIVNFLIKPILKVITLPLKFLTLGLSSFIINIGLVWLVVGIFFNDSFIVVSWLGYLWIFLIIWILSILLISKKK
ncbi:MAG: phage holin family protein [Candidatus Pacebacteria bacterium]|nr:phage holin family protein [Candidatus Paceibacterota bacterium]